MAKFASLFLVVFLASSSLAAPSSAKIASEVTAALAKSGTVEVLISFNGPANLKSFDTRSFVTAEARNQAVIAELKAKAEPVQAGVMSFLRKQRSLNQEQVWALSITNQIFVKEATAEIIETIANFAEVTEIKINEYIPLETSEVLPGVSPKDAGILAEWGVENIGAHHVWAHANGNTGQGVRIATIDTGARGTHETLRNNFNGQWLDPYTNSATPLDQNGHGTHTTSTIAGHGGVGVAPGATWSACRGCDTSTCGNAQLIRCGEWAVCPNSPSCSLAPHLVSNSWGGGRGNTFYDQVVSGWHAANIIPLFSNGNSGPACNTANSPADSASGVLGIGSTTSANALSSFSSKGPSIFGGIKPDISAPGSSINAAYHTSDTAYAVLSGTSMSCPHAAGAVALLKSHRVNLTYAQIKNLLEAHANKQLTPTGQNCGGISDNIYPNHSYGAGKVDVLASFNALLAQK
jgi:subtilisin family serine protease